MKAGEPAVGAKPRRICCEFAIASMLAILIPIVEARAQATKSKGSGALESTPSIASYVPRQDLLLYFEFKGLDAQAELWQKTAAYRLLSEAKLGALLEDMAIQAVEIYQQTAPSKVRIKGVDAVHVLKELARHGFAFAVSGKPPDRSRCIVLLAEADKPEFKTVLQGLEASLGGEIEGGAEPGAVEKGGRKLRRLGADRVWWVEKGTLIITDRTKADEILDVIAGRSPSAVDHPLRRDVQGERGF